MKDIPVAIPIPDNEPIIVIEPAAVNTHDKCAMYLRYLSILVFIVIVIMVVESTKK